MLVQRWRYKLWWSENTDEIVRGVRIVVKELCNKVVEVCRKSNRVMAEVLVVEEDVMSHMCVCSPDKTIRL